MVYLPTFWLILMVNVGEYTIPMNPMGNFLRRTYRVKNLAIFFPVAGGHHWTEGPL